MINHHKITNLVIVTSNYPSKSSPANGTFVRNTVRALAHHGIECTVINPVNSRSPFSKWLKPIEKIDTVSEGRQIKVYTVKYFSVGAKSSYAKMGLLNPTLLTTANFYARVKRILNKLDVKPDALYGHFLHISGVVVSELGEKYSIPAFVCVGEGEFWTVERYGWGRMKQKLRDTSGFLANSTVLKRELIKKLDIPPKKIKVFPNGADVTHFYPRNRGEARKKFNLPTDGFLVASVGNFLHKKGICRVGEAIRNLQDVYGVFAGSGSEPPVAENILFCDRVPHEDLPWLLSACDVFVLPTLIEGSCNAIVEAMACGLPVISSNYEFNDDLLVPAMSIRVDPLDVEAIRAAIVTLRDDPDLRERMSSSALEHAKDFDVNDRARRMIAFMQRSVL